MPRTDSITGQTIASDHRNSNYTVPSSSSYTTCKEDITISTSKDPIKASRFVITLDRCIFKDTSEHTVFVQRFLKGRDQHQYHPWRRPGQTQLQVTFASGEQGHIRIGEDESAPDRKEIPKYFFGNADDYRDFQTHLYGKAFRQEFETVSIDTTTLGNRKSSGQFIKVWNGPTDAHDGSVTLPVDVNGNMEFVDLKFRQFKVEKRDLDRMRVDISKWQIYSRLRLTLISSKDERSSPVPSNPRQHTSKRRTFSGALSFSKTRTLSIPGEKQDVAHFEPAPPNLVQLYAHFDIVFRSHTDRNDFITLHESYIRPSALPNDANKSPVSTISHPTSFESSGPSSEATTFVDIPIGSPVFHQDFHLEPRNSSPTFLLEDQPSEPPSVDNFVKPFSNPALYDISATTEEIEVRRQGGPHNPNVFQASDELRQNSQFYENLANDEIRLMRIKRGDYEDPLACKLEHHSLRQAPDYEAVSYCWGEVGETASIMIGSDKAFKVSRHLWAGLRRLRCPDRDRLVWIDAVCINQTNIAEKNHQIPQMRNIYGKAYRTLIWIGNLGMEKDNCSRRHRAEKDVPAAGDTLCVSMFSNQSQLDHVSLSDLEKPLQDLRSDLQKRNSSEIWWRRLWVLQEYHFSFRLPIVFIGTHSLDWKHFASFFDVTDDSNPLALFENLRDPPDRQLFELLLLARSLDCNDIRDRVYGLLSMVPDADKRIVPDYGKSVLRVLEETCVYLVQQNGLLDVLLDGRVDRAEWGPSKLRNVFPTWLPELTTLLDEKAVQGADGCMSGTLGKEGRVRAQIELLEERSTDGFDDPRHLRIWAIRFGKVMHRTEEQDTPNPIMSPSQSLIYNNLEKRGPLLEAILDKLEYDYHSKSKWEFEKSPCLGRLMHNYLFEGARSFVEEMQRRTKAQNIIEEMKRKNEYSQVSVIEPYEEQQRKDLAYIEKYAGNRDDDITYVQERWALKISRAQNEDVYVPRRMTDAIKLTSIDIDFRIARDFENLFAYARKTNLRYYFNGNNFDAPMRSDVLNVSTVSAANSLGSRLKEVRKGAPNPEYHEYNAKNRQRDFFITEDGFLGLGPSTLEPNDVVVVPLGSSRPWILRPESTPDGTVYALIGEALVPGIMSGTLLKQENAKVEAFVLR